MTLIHTPTTPMEPVRIVCPFDQWGIDILGSFPPAAAQKKFIIVAVEYFTKWVEAEALAKISEKEVIKFIWKNIICRFGIPRVLISNNVGNPQANGQTEVTNRTIFQHLKTRLEGAKGLWVEELPGVLWAYRTTPRSATGETTFCLVYGTEAIIHVEVREETQRVAQYDAAKNQEKQAFDLTVIEEKRDGAYARILHHKGLMMRSYNQKIRARTLQGDQSQKARNLQAARHGGKRPTATLEHPQFEEVLHMSGPETYFGAIFAGNGRSNKDHLLTPVKGTWEPGKCIVCD
ncbi:UNVERIFIED_CONTAM: Gag-Pol polyprotein [Sesamum latifolium]|uniref:Gag-Pol polyprotein n=1 Tax=Sesamum latifolium TaxID=2727402 RepID=A0AAW2X738_9LAMI